MDNEQKQTTSVVGIEPTTNENHLPAPVQPFHGLSRINLFDEKQLIAAENFILKIMKSEKGGIKSVNDGLAILMRAQDLNLPFSTSIEHIHVINGKTGVDIHIVKALILKAGGRWNCTKDYQPLYEYTDSINVYCDGRLPDYAVKCKSKEEAILIREKSSDDDKIYVYPVKWYSDFSGNIYRDYQLNTVKFQIVTSAQEAKVAQQNNKIGVYRIPNRPIDYITEYEIFRNIGGKEVSSIGHFSYTEAVEAGMFEKDTYKKYARILIGHRAFTYAARDLYSDILFGVMETTELKIVAGKELDSADILDIEAEEVK
jgi:hypothetical protein